MFERTISLLGEETFKKIQSKTVLIVGIGGVGGFATEALVRSGINNIILIDYDKIDITNLNRQIISTNKNVKIYIRRQMNGGLDVSRTICIYVTQPPALLQKSRYVAIR